MNLVVRRRLAVSALAASSALVAGVLLAPSSNAATNALSISPSIAFNNDTADVLTFSGKDADFEFGGTATFTRINGGQPFDVTMDSDQPPTGSDQKQTATVNFTDPDGAATAPDGGVGKDGPADAGTYNVNASGAPSPTQPVPNPLAPGGGSDNCASCFTVDAAGPVSVSGATPTSYRPGATGNITIAGNNFERGTHVDFLFADGSIDPLVTANANPKDYSKTGNPDIVDQITTRTSLKRTAHVDGNDTPGARGIRVTNLDGTTNSCTSCFFVAGPTLTSISPTGGANDPGTIVTVTFTGSNVTANGTPRLEYTGDPGSSTRDALSLDPTSFTPSNGSSMTGTFDLSNAAPGPYQGVVRDKSTGITNACEQPACSVFTVAQQASRKPPTVTSLDDPATAGSQHSQPAGTTRVFDVNGTNFSKGVLIKTTATKTTVTGVEFVSPSLVKATITTAKDETAGNYDVTATLTDGTASAACKGCYTVGANTPSPSTSSSSSAAPCPTATSSSTAKPSTSASASTPASGSASPSASGSGSGSGSSPTALAVAAASPSDTATATTSPSSSSSASSGCLPLTLRLNSADTITPGTDSLMTAHGSPNAAVVLRCYSRTPENGNEQAPPYFDARNKTLSSSGSYQFALHPGTNTRCFVKYAGSADTDTNASKSLVQKVATALSLSAYRDGVRKYHFQGTNLPRRSGQLITLYRYATASNGYCVPAPESYGSAATTASCRAIRTATAYTASNNVWRIDRTFTGSGQFYFVVRTSDNITNVGGYSNQRLTVIH